MRGGAGRDYSRWAVSALADAQQVREFLELEGQAMVYGRLFGTWAALQLCGTPMSVLFCDHPTAM